jgi:DNA-binding GntR family transcriptional regulator
MTPDDPAPPDTTPGTATERVYDSLYTDILERRLAPGTRLREEELAARFAVSRTVIRQALHRLAQDQVIALNHNRGAQVPAPTREDAAHVFDARRVVECEIARRLAGRLAPAQRVQLQALVDAEARADALGDRSAAIRLSGEFHRALAQMCGNPVFLRLLEGLLPTTSLLMALYQPDGMPACVLHRHAELISALERPGAAAATEMRRHLQEIERSLHPAARPTPVAPRDTFKAYRELTD